MDITPYVAASIVALLGLIAAIAGYDSRDGFDQADTRHHR